MFVTIDPYNFFFVNGKTILFINKGNLQYAEIALHDWSFLHAFILPSAEPDLMSEAKLGEVYCFTPCIKSQNMETYNNKHLLSLRGLFLEAGSRNIELMPQPWLPETGVLKFFRSPRLKGPHKG